MRARIALGALGLLAMAYAVVGAVGDPDIARLGHLTFLAAVLVGHDAVLLPAGLLVGALAARLLPAPARLPVQCGLFASAVVTVIALPLLIGDGHPVDNPSALPRDYPLGLLVTLGAVWAPVAVAVLTRHLRARRAGTPRGDAGA